VDPYDNRNRGLAGREVQVHPMWTVARRRANLDVTVGDAGVMGGVVLLPATQCGAALPDPP
jgi:hypothetical protein